MQRAESKEIELPRTEEKSAPAQALTPEDSIQNDKVICLECGAEMRQVTSKHMVSHGMNQIDSYASLVNDIHNETTFSQRARELQYIGTLHISASWIGGGGNDENQFKSPGPAHNHRSQRSKYNPSREVW
ncbi:MAG: MucR family transcriptional regulator [Syntrophobacteraceae bacterium]